MGCQGASDCSLTTSGPVALFLVPVNTKRLSLGPFVRARRVSAGPRPREGPACGHSPAVPKPQLCAAAGPRPPAKADNPRRPHRRTSWVERGALSPPPPPAPQLLHLTSFRAKKVRVRAKGGEQTHTTGRNQTRGIVGVKTRYFCLGCGPARCMGLGPAAARSPLSVPGDAGRAPGPGPRLPPSQLQAPRQAPGPAASSRGTAQTFLDSSTVQVRGEGWGGGLPTARTSWPRPQKLSVKRPAWASSAE